MQNEKQFHFQKAAKFILRLNSKIYSMYILSIFCIALFPSISRAQNLIPIYAWSHTITNPNSMWQFDIKADHAGNTISTGYFTGTSDFDPAATVFNLSTIGLLDTNIFIRKLDSNGHFMWAKKLGSTSGQFASGFEIAVDINNNIFIYGKFNGTMDADPGVGIFNLNSINGNGFLLKLNSQGNFVWAINTADVVQNEKIWHSSAPIAATFPQRESGVLTLDSLGHIYLGGLFSNTYDFDPGPGMANYTSSVIYYATNGYVLKLDTNAQYIWVKIFQGQVLDISIDCDSMGNVYNLISYNNIDSIDADPGVGVQVFPSFYLPGGENGSFLAKLDPNGSFQWAKGGGLSGLPCRVVSSLDYVKVSKSGMIYTTSQTWDVGLLCNHGLIYLLKYDPNGTLVDSVYLCCHIIEINDFNIDKEGNLYMSVSGLGGELGLNTQTGANVLKFDSNLNIIWNKPLVKGNLYPWSITNILGTSIDDNNNIYMTGDFSSGILSCDPNSIVNGLYVSTNQNLQVPVSIKWKQLPPCGAQYYDTLNASACSMYTSPSGNYFWNTSGVYIDTLYTSNACDSILTINLTIGKILDSLAVTTCNSYTFNGQTFTSSGIYKDTFLAAGGCDSIIILNLTIGPLQPTIIQTGSQLQCTNVTNVNYQWFLNSNAIGTNSNTLIISQTGTYVVVTSDNNNCTGTDTLTVISLGLVENNMTSHQLYLYPNPTTGMVTISHPTNVSYISLLDMAGRELMLLKCNINSTETTLQLTNLPNGLYQIKADGYVPIKVLKR